MDDRAAAGVKAVWVVLSPWLRPIEEAQAIGDQDVRTMR